MSDGCRVRMMGPLVLYADGFREELAAHGYAVQTTDRNLRILAHLSSWMLDQGLSVAELSGARVEGFIEARRHEGYGRWLSVPAVMPLIGYLRRFGIVPAAPETAEPTSVADRAIEDYRRYLTSERGLTADVVRKYTRLGRQFRRAGGVSQRSTGQGRPDEPVPQDLRHPDRAGGEACSPSGSPPRSGPERVRGRRCCGRGSRTGRHGLCRRRRRPAITGWTRR